MTLRLVVTLDAQDQINEADIWWFEHRRRMPNRVEEEVARAFALLVESPGIGVLYSNKNVPGLRRYRLHGTPYYIYYSVDSDKESLVVAALWSAMRNEGLSI